MNHSKLDEGLRGGELNDLVMPLLSIDEYESKISDNKEVIVIGFYVDHEDPAKELSRFVDKSIEDILDTDVSPAPTPSGYFVVFVEIERSDKVFGIITNILKEIQNLVEIDEWQFKAYKQDKVMPLTKENFYDTVRITEPTHESFKLHKFLENMLLDNISFNDNIVELGRHTFKVAEHMSVISESILGATLEDIAATQRFNCMFGPSYQTNVQGNSVEIFNIYRGETLRLKKL